MTKLKCKVCGGELTLVNESIAECQACQNKMLLPLIDEDIRNDMFNRGNYYRMHYEFERAASAFEQIISRDPNDAEARFCLALCHFGVEYVKDPRSGVYMPVCHRSNRHSILDDVDYKAALQFAPPQIQNVYKKQAADIHEIWQQMMNIANYEEPYDAFICYKETPGEGVDPQQRGAGNARTPDSVLAQDLYEELTKRGLRVFFSRISLENKLGSAYEPYIFAALQSAKVMLVIGTRREYMEAVWVKNEWQRYLNLRSKDHSREIIPVLQGMDAYDMPDELSEFIPRDMDETGAKQDLIRGILKITGHTEGNTGMIRHRDLAQLASKLLARGKYEEAKTAADQMLNLNPSSGVAYKILFLVNVRAGNLEACKELDVDFNENPAFLRFQKYAVGDLKRELEELVTYRQKRSFYFEGQGYVGQDYEQAYHCFLKADNYKDAKVQAAECKKKAEEEKKNRLLQENIQKYREELQKIKGKVESEWPKLYPDMEARRQKFLKEMNVSKPFSLGVILSIILLGIFCALPTFGDEWKMIGTFLTLGLNALVACLVIKMVWFVLRGMGGIVKTIAVFVSLFISAQGMVFIQKFFQSLFPDKVEDIAWLLGWIGVSAICLLGFLISFFYQAKKYVAAENYNQEKKHFWEAELPELKKQLAARKLEELRIEYEAVIGAENCLKYAHEAN